METCRTTIAFVTLTNRMKNPRLPHPRRSGRHSKIFIIDAVDPQYIEELKEDYVGYANDTAKTMLAHIKSTWCKITNHETGGAQRALREPWNLVEDITAYKRSLKKNQMNFFDLGVPINDSDKVQIYMENMYVWTLSESLMGTLRSKQFIWFLSRLRS